jgi:hypothetical protein
MKKTTANLRESSRIAFFLRRRALLRLFAYAESHAVWKNAGGKTGVPVFLLVNFSFLSNRKIMKHKKNPHAGFSLSIFQVRVRFCVGDQPEQSTRT